MALRARAGLGLALCAVALAGCGQAPAPKPLPAPSTSSSPSPTAQAAPAMPPEVRQKTRAGAEATVRWFIDALNYAGVSGQTGPLRASFIDFCTTCDSYAKGIEDTYAAGGYLRGTAWLKPRLKFHAIDGDIAYIDVIVDYPDQEIRKSRNKASQHVAASAGHLHAFQLKWMSAKLWRVGALDPGR